MAMRSVTCGYGLAAHGTALCAPPSPAGQQSKATQVYRAPARPHSTGHKSAQVLHSTRAMGSFEKLDRQQMTAPSCDGRGRSHCCLAYSERDDGHSVCVIVRVRDRSPRCVARTSHRLIRQAAGFNDQSRRQQFTPSIGGRVAARSFEQTVSTHCRRSLGLCERPDCSGSCRSPPAASGKFNSYVCLPVNGHSGCAGRGSNGLRPACRERFRQTLSWYLRNVRSWHRAGRDSLPDRAWHCNASFPRVERGVAVSTRTQAASAKQSQETQPARANSTTAHAQGMHYRYEFLPFILPANS